MKKPSKARTQKLLADFEKAATSLRQAELKGDQSETIFGWALVTDYALQALKRHFGEDGFMVCLDAKSDRVYAELKGKIEKRGRLDILQGLTEQGAEWKLVTTSMNRIVAGTGNGPAAEQHLFVDIRKALDWIIEQTCEKGI